MQYRARAHAAVFAASATLRYVSTSHAAPRMNDLIADAAASRATSASFRDRPIFQ